MINAGDLRHPIDILRKVKSVDVLGAEVWDYQLIKSTRARILGKVGNEFVLNASIVNESSNVILIRFTDITESDVIQLGNIYYNINYIDNVLQENTKMLVYVTERIGENLNG